MNSIDQQFVEYVVKSLVSKPDAVKIDRRIDEKGVLLELSVDPEDLGRVIGKRGATAQSLRTLLRALGTKNDARYNLKIIDNGPADYSRNTKPEGHEKPAREVKLEEDKTDSEETEINLNESSESSEDRFSKTRRELEEMDDLDL